MDLPSDLIKSLQDMAAQPTSEDHLEDAKRFHETNYPESPWDSAKFDITDGESHDNAVSRGTIDGEAKLARRILEALGIEFEPYPGADWSFPQPPSE